MGVSQGLMLLEGDLFKPGSICLRMKCVLGPCILYTTVAWYLAGLARHCWSACALQQGFPMSVLSLHLPWGFVVGTSQASSDLQASYIPCVVLNLPDARNLCWLPDVQHGGPLFLPLADMHLFSPLLWDDICRRQGKCFWREEWEDKNWGV